MLFWILHFECVPAKKLGWCQSWTTASTRSCPNPTLLTFCFPVLIVWRKLYLNLPNSMSSMTLCFCLFRECSGLCTPKKPSICRGPIPALGEIDAFRSQEGLARAENKRTLLDHRWRNVAPLTVETVPSTWLVAGAGGSTCVECALLLPAAWL